MSDAIYKLKMGQDNYNDIKFNQYDKGGYITFKLLDAEGQAFNVQEGDLVTAEWNMTNNKAIIQTKVDGIIQTTGSNIVKVFKDRRITRNAGKGYLSIAVTNKDDTTRTSTFINKYKVFTGAISEINGGYNDDLAIIEVLNGKIVETTYKVEETEEVIENISKATITGRNTYEKLEQDINTADAITDELKNACNKAEADMSRLKTDINTANTVLPQIDEKVANATNINETLGTTNTTASQTLTDLTDKNTEANTTLTDLTSANNTGNTLHTNLSEDISTGNALHTNLGEDITNATTIKNGLETAISNGDIDSIVNVTNTTLKTALLNMFYPIGSHKFTSNNVNPSTTLGGTWVQRGQGEFVAGVSTYIWERTA